MSERDLKVVTNLLFKSWQVRVGGGCDHVIKEWQVLVNVLKNVKRSGKRSYIIERDIGKNFLTSRTENISIAFMCVRINDLKI